MLVRDIAAPPLPGEFAAGLVNDADGVGLAETNQQVAIVSYVEGVLVRPLLAPFQEADAVLIEIEVVP